MNIFFLDDSPYIAAAGHCNKHCVRMPTEAANMLMWPMLYSGELFIKTVKGARVKLSHENHPVSKWVRESSANYEWAVSHLRALVTEYLLRYRRNHWAGVVSAESGVWLDRHRSDFSKDYQTPFPRCFSTFAEELIGQRDTVEAYRQFYWLDKREFARWPSAEAVPKWWPDDPKKYVDKSFKEGKYIKK